MDTEYVTIKNYPNYEINKLGLIRNKKNNKILKPFINSCYYRVNLYLSKTEKKLCQLHRILAEVFIENPENKKEVNHIDGNKLNNSLDNLEWVTRVENALHSYKYGLQKSKKGKNNDKHKKVIQFDLNNKEIKVWDCVMDIERELGLSSGGISNSCLGKSKTSYGFKWKYINN